MTRSEIEAKLTRLAREMSSIPRDGGEITPALRLLLKEQERMLTAYRDARREALSPVVVDLLDNVLSDQDAAAVVLARMKGSPQGATPGELKTAVDWARRAAITAGLLRLVTTGQVVIVGMDGEDNPVFKADPHAS